MKPKMKMIVIPDLHGRTFWKEAIPYVEAGVPCIFLGDYVDPFPFDGISNQETVDNLKDVVAFARANRDRVTLLLGNHDLSYFGTYWGLWTVFADRFSLEWGYDIAEVFNEDNSLFSMCLYLEVGGRQLLFSHAGIHPLWVKNCDLFYDVDVTDGKALAMRVEELFHESLLEEERTDFMEALSMVGYSRGGNDIAGSMVWAGIREFKNVSSDFWQIVGHTAQWNANDGSRGVPLTVGNTTCVDCIRCFYIDDGGQLHCLDDEARGDLPLAGERNLGDLGNRLL